MTMADAVRDNPARHRFELAVEGEMAFANYHRDGSVLTVMHTKVPRHLEGRGIGSRLVAGVLDIARAQELTVVPRCSFVRAYIKRHPHYADLLAHDPEKGEPVFGKDHARAKEA
jgi:predicted GNAT family acetyltransferase